MRKNAGWQETVRAWIKASRPPFFIASLCPLIIGWFLAIDGNWHTGRFLIVVLGSFIVHLATNIANDYFDHMKGVDGGRSIGGSRVIQEGKIAPAVLLRGIIILYFLAFLILLYIVIALRLVVIFPLALFAFLSSLFYVAPPVRYGYHGLGELSVGINMGPIIIVGTYIVISGRYDWTPLLVSVPVGFMVASILFYQSLPDMETDLASGKYTLAVKLGRMSAFRVLIAFWVCIYLIIVALIGMGVLSWYALFSLLTVPIFVKIAILARDTADWLLLDRHGRYIRLLYVLNFFALMAGMIKM